jgi:hypothetical protein
MGHSGGGQRLNRPLPAGGFAAFRAADCAKFNHWRYGPIQDFRGRLWFAPGVAHVGGRMLDSVCGIAASFDRGRCADQAAVVSAPVD